MGINYVIDGHNARVSFYYQYGNIGSVGGLTALADDASKIGLGIQLQI
ncbi:MAG: hypothetical protein HRU01_12870 [Myxococcales bacterium]|nr:hypothetical protein [Myxococcales bacterium]